MRRALSIVLLLIGCDQGVKKAPHDPDKRVPPGPYVIRYDCFHSDQPFGPGNQIRNQSFDLGRKVRTTLAYEYSSDPLPAGASAVPRVPVDAPIADDKVKRLEAAVVKVLSGGPYKPEYPVPEGTPCDLAISAAGTEVFKLETPTRDRVLRGRGGRSEWLRRRPSRAPARHGAHGRPVARALRYTR